MNLVCLIDCPCISFALTYVTLLSFIIINCDDAHLPEPGTIRGDFCIEVGRNICHGSDSVENAEKEIKLWFEEGEVLDWESHSKDWLYE